MAKKKWHSQKDSFQAALHYMKGRQDGVITSFKTPWKKMNDVTTDGLEWGSMTVIGGRPGSGKTLIKDQIIREGVRLNCSLDEYEQAKFPFRILEFQFEMVGRVSAMREFSSVLKKSYRYINSAGGTIISDDDMITCLEYSRKRIHYPIDVVDETCTVKEFKETVEAYMNAHAYENEKEERIYKNTIVTLDHTVLLKTEKGEIKYDMLYNLGETITELKRKYPICFIILSQLNREIDKAGRNEEGSYGNYVLESDIFGADAMLQHADTVLGIDRPGKRRLHKYGPEQYKIPDDKLLAFHFLKCRNSETKISWFRAEFDKMRVVETETPDKIEKRVKI